MRRIRMVLAVIAAALGLAFAAPSSVPGLSVVAPQSAEAFSIDYCNPNSLRGFGTAAPDDDIKAQWDKFTLIGLRPSSSYAWSQWWLSVGTDALVVWRFNTVGGPYYVNFRCWIGSAGVYHDGIR